MEKITSFFNNLSSEDVFNFILNPEFEGWLLVVKAIFIIVSLILLGAIIPLILTTSWLGYRYARDLTEFTTYRPFGAKKSLKQWIKIINRLKTNKEAEYKLAVIEADNMLEGVLEKINIKGETMTEKLENIDLSVLSNKEQALEARKVRNEIVRNPDYELSLEQAKKTIDVYEEALRNLEAF